MTYILTNLEAFTNSYIECALWASTYESTRDGETWDQPIDGDYGPESIDPESLKAMKDDCRKFVEENLETIEADPVQDFSDAGHDFFLTRNGHGAGFWDSDWAEPGSDKLDKASEAFGECHLYVENDTIYII